MELFEILFYSEEELTPLPEPSLSPRKPLFGPEVLDRLDEILSNIDKGPVDIPLPVTESLNELLTILKILDSLGALSLELASSNCRICNISKIATNFSRVFSLYLRHRFQMISDWHHLTGVEGHFYGIDLLLFLEKNRIKYSVETGFRPEIFLEKKVAFAVIKGYSLKHKKNLYLLQMNKDWQRYNLIGGKQEAIDRVDYRRTVLREIQEELNIDAKSVNVSELTHTPIRSYGMTGHNGALCSYDCMLYQAFFTKQIPFHSKNKWVTEEELILGRGKEGERFMINPYYREYLANLSERLESLPNSFKEPIDNISTMGQIYSFIVEHRMLITAILIILAALIGLAKAIFF